MPITKSAKKALRQSGHKKVVNDRRKKVMKEATKKIEKLVREKSLPEAKNSLKEAYSAIDKAAKRGVIKKNTADRRKSRLSRISKAV